MVENQIGVEVVAIERQAILPGHEGEAGTEFEQEILQVVRKSGFEIVFDQPVRFGQSEEFEHVGVFDGIRRVFNGMSPAGEVKHAILIPAFEQPLKEQGVDLAFELSDRPPLPIGLTFIEGAFLVSLDPHKEAVMRPSKIGQKTLRVRMSLR